MNLTNSCGLITSGMVAGALLVLSCSDESPGTADAATCDCPPAEAPLAGRVQQITATQTIAPNATGGQSNRCPEGSVFLSGGYGTEDGQSADIVLRQSRPAMTGDGWACDFKNESTTSVTIKATSYCLVPAS